MYESTAPIHQGLGSFMEDDSFAVGLKKELRIPSFLVSSLAREHWFGSLSQQI